MHARRLTALAAALVTALPLAAGCTGDLAEPRGELGVLGVARFTHDLEGPLGPTPLATGARFVVAANQDGCDRLTEVDCDPDQGALLVRAADPNILELTPRADGALGASARMAGSTVVFAVDGNDDVVDYLDLQIANPVAVALTDQAFDGRRAEVLPLDWAVEAGQEAELRAVLVDRHQRVLLSGDPAFNVELELRDAFEGDVPEVLAPNLSDLTADHIRLRAPNRAATLRAVLYAADRSLDASVYRISVLLPAAGDRLRVEVRDVESRPGFDVVTVDLCAVRERFDAAQRVSIFMVGHDYQWRPPWGFEIVNKGIGIFPGTGPDGSRCVRAVRFDDREVPPSDRFFVTHGDAEGSVPMGVAMGKVKRPQPWWAPLWEGTQALVQETTQPNAD